MTWDAARSVENARRGHPLLEQKAFRNLRLGGL
jgi:hypothetical protein